MKGKDIKEVLQKHGIAQTEIARTLGLAPNNLNNRQARSPRPVRLAAAREG